MNTKTTLRRKILKLVCGGAVLAVGLLGFSLERRINASSSGPLPSHTGAPGEQTCVACHSGFPVNSGGGNLTITGLPGIYFPNQDIAVTVTLTDANAKLFGFQMTAVDRLGRQAGNFVIPAQDPSPVQIIGGTVGNVERSYIEHTAEGITPTQQHSRSWTFLWRGPNRRTGRVRLFAAGNGADGGGDTGGDHIYATNRILHSGPTLADFDGDHVSDISVFRPSDGVWYIRNSSNGSFRSETWGLSGDKPIGGDFDGDGRADLAVWRPGNGYWYIRRSSDGQYIFINWGASGDIPLSGDFDGDGRTDFTVFRPSVGVWHILSSATFNYRGVRFGQAGDIPMAGDFDADAKTDLAVFRSGTWFILKSRDDSFHVAAFGLSTDTPLAADFDGDGSTDIGVFRPSEGSWYLLNSAQGFRAVRFGIGTDVPVAGDHDNDGSTDISVFRDGTWYILASSDGQVRSEFFGLGGDIPIAAR